MRALTAGLAGLLLCLSASVTAADAPRTLRFYSYAYDLKTNAFLYAERHEQKIAGDRWVGGSITYYGPDGKEMGRKTLDFSQNEFVPTYELILDADGYREGISAVGKTVDMFKQSNGKSKLKRESLPLTAGMAADSGFHSYLRAHFAELMAGKPVEFRLAVAGELDSFKFVARKVGETTFEGKPAIRLRAEANSLLSLVAPVLDLVYDPADRNLLEYRGITNVHNPRTGDPFEARISFYSTPPADAPKLPALK